MKNFTTFISESPEDLSEAPGKYKKRGDKELYQWGDINQALMQAGTRPPQILDILTKLSKKEVGVNEEVEQVDEKMGDAEHKAAVKYITALGKKNRMSVGQQRMDIDDFPKKYDAKTRAAAKIINKNQFSVNEEEVLEAADPKVGKAVQGLNDLGNKMKGRDQKDIRRIEKLYRSGNKKVFQGAIRALDTDLRDQVMDIFDALGMVKRGVIESVEEVEEAKAPKIKKMVIKGNEISGLKSGLTSFSAKPVENKGKLAFRVVDEFGGFETLDLKAFAKKFG